jgi:hypothetical protein
MLFFQKNIFIFLAFYAKPTPLYWRKFGQNILASYWSGKQQALAFT